MKRLIDCERTVIARVMQNWNILYPLLDVWILDETPLVRVETAWVNAGILRKPEEQEEN